MWSPAAPAPTIFPPGRRIRSGNHRRVRRAVRGDREARRPHHPDGEPRARRVREIARRLRARLRPHPVAGQGAGDHPLAGRDVRSGAGRLLGQEGSLRRDGCLPGRDPAQRSKVDGIKVSLLDKDKEIAMRRKLPKGVRMYTGDDFNFAELIEGDAQGYSDALLGIFDSIAPAASRPCLLLRRTKGGVSRDPRADGPAVAPHLQRADALLQDRRRVHGVAERPPGPLRDGRRPAVGAQRPASRRAVPPRRRRGPARRPAARLRAHEATAGDAGCG